MEILQEKVIKSPYDLREMLWFIIPGATLMLVLFLFEFWFVQGVKDTGFKYGYILHTPIFTTLSLTHTDPQKIGDNWVLSAVYLLLIITICYILGHITYMVGTFLYERGLVKKGYDYPYIQLLNLPKHDSKSELELSASQGFYKGFAFWIAVFLLTVYLTYVFWGYNSECYIIYEWLMFLLGFFSILIPLRKKFILGRLTKIKNISNKDFKIKGKLPIIRTLKGLLFWILFITLLFGIATLLDYASGKNLALMILGSILLLVVIYEILFNYKVKKNRRWYRIKLLYRFKLCYNYLGNEFDNFVRDYLKVQTTFEESFVGEYEKCFYKVYRINYKDIGRHNYWFSKFFVMENSYYLSHQINYWENIYRFTKSLAAAFFIASFYCGASVMLQYKYLLNYDEQYPIFVLKVIPILLFILNIMCIRYYFYVYDNRYTRMILRSFVSIVKSRNWNQEDILENNLIGSSRYEQKSENQIFYFDVEKEKENLVININLKRKKH